MKNPIKRDDLGVPLFLETPICDWEERLQNMIQHARSIEAAILHVGFVYCLAHDSDT